MSRAYDATTTEEEKRLLLGRFAKAHMKDYFDYSFERLIYLPEELHRELRRASREILEDRDLALAAVAANGHLLQHFGPAIRADLGVALAAVRNCASSFEHVGPDLQGDRALLLEALPRYPHALMWASDQLRNDRELVVKAVKAAGDTLQHASVELRGDKEVVFLAVEKCGQALEFASDELRSCQALAIEAVRSVHAEHDFRAEGDSRVMLNITMDDGSGLAFAHETLQSNKDFALSAVKESWTALADVRADLEGDPEIVREALAQFGGALLLASNALTDDEELVLQAVEQWAGSLQFASDRLRADKDFLLRATRACRCEADALECYFQAEASLKSSIPWEKFSEVWESALAIPGQRAPVLSVTLSKVPEIPKIPNVAEVSEVRKVLEVPGAGAGAGGGAEREAFNCQATLLSGQCFDCEVAAGLEGVRSPPTVNDLARLLVAKVQTMTEADSVEHIFITILRDDGDFVAVTAWDWARPLADFLPEVPGFEEIQQIQQVKNSCCISPRKSLSFSRFLLVASWCR